MKTELDGVELDGWLWLNPNMLQWWWNRSAYCICSSTGRHRQC